MNKQDILNILVTARNLITDSSHWTKGLLARDSQGREIDYNSNEATCWCISGAIFKVMGYIGTSNPNMLIHNTLKKYLPPGFTVTVYFNDHEATTHADIMALFDRTIAGIQSEQS